MPKWCRAVSVRASIITKNLRIDSFFEIVFVGNIDISKSWKLNPNPKKMARIALATAATGRKVSDDSNSIGLK